MKTFPRIRRQSRRPASFAVVILCTLAVMLALMAAGLYLSARQAESGMEQTLNARVEKARIEQAMILNNLYQTTRNILGNVMYDSEIYKILRYTADTDAQAIRTIRNKLRMAQNTHLNGIDYRLALLDLNGNMYTNWLRGAGFYDEIMSREEVQDALQKEKSFFLMQHGFWYTDDENPVTRVPAISFGNVVLDQYLSGPVGILLFSAEESSLVSALEQDGAVALTNTLTGERLCGSVEEALYDYVRADEGAFPLGEIVQVTWQGQQMLVCRSLTAASHIELLQVMSFDEMYKELISLQHLNTMLLLFTLGAMALVLTAVTAGISRPLRRLYQQVRNLNIQLDGTIPMITAQGYRECVEVADAINEMSERTMEMIEAIKKQQKDRAELKYQYLLSQLDPHFLLNTLNNVKWTAYMSNAPRVAEMIMALGFLLETSLGKNQGEVTISYEIAHVRNYMLLQNMHYGDEVTYTVTADEAALNLPFERFTLQTLVGNAIKHGYIKGKPLQIEIRIEIEGGQLCIAVQDNGQGMKQEHLRQVHEELRASEEGERSGHIGLRNLCQRLAYRYGGQAELTIDSVEGEMTRVTLRVPLSCLRKGAED